MTDLQEAGKRGYLLENYRVFHLKDEHAFELAYHYHEFDKIVFQLTGRITYHVEGKQYALQPYDILVVRHNLIHRPVVETDDPYERIVVWLSRDYLDRMSHKTCDLSTCFSQTANGGFHLLRPRGEERNRYRALFGQVEEALAALEFGAELLGETYLLQLLISLGRDCLKGLPTEEGMVYRFDPKMEEITKYVEAHLGEELSIDHLSNTFYLSRYYLMHRFKEIYGITIHQYIRQKRLLFAAEQIRSGVPVLKAAVEAGFNDYSAFLRAFRSMYDVSPRDLR